MVFGFRKCKDGYVTICNMREAKALWSLFKSKCNKVAVYTCIWVKFQTPSKQLKTRGSYELHFPFFEIFFLFLHLILINQPCSNMLMARLFHKSTITFVSGNHCRLLTWNPSKGQNQEDQESKFLEIDLTNKVWFAILYSVYTYYTSS